MLVSFYPDCDGIFQGMHISMATKQEMSALLPDRHRVLLNYLNLDVIQFQSFSHIFSLVVKSSEDVESTAVQSGREEIAIGRHRYIKMWSTSMDVSE